MVDGKLVPGDVLLDWTLGGPDRVGERVVVSVVSGKLPTPIDDRDDPRGQSSSERCALWGASSGSERRDRRREVARLQRPVREAHDAH